MVEVTVGGGGQLQGTEADVVQSLVVDAVGLVGVLHQLVHGQGGVVGLHHGVRHLQVHRYMSGTVHTWKCSGTRQVWTHTWTPVIACIICKL